MIQKGLLIGKTMSGKTMSNERAIYVHEIHELKIIPKYFEDVKSGKKNFEIRKDDRDYKVGDLITLKEYENGQYTGREIKNLPIIYILRGATKYGLMDGYCILGF